MNNAPIILWLRQDLRLSDNPALVAAVETGAPVIALYILDDVNAEAWAPGSASRWWLHHALHDLNKNINGNLIICHGDARIILPALAKETGARAVFWNRCYEPWRITRDADLKKNLKGENIDVQTFNSFLLHEPWAALKDDGTPYRVFTPFYKACMAKGDPAAPLPAPKTVSWHKPVLSGALKNIEALELLPAFRWDRKMEPHWAIGESGARERLHEFLDSGAPQYKSERDRPDKDIVSRLSPYLHFGHISPRQIWHASGDRSEAFLRQLIWREFCWSLLYHNHDMPEQPLQKKFTAFPWRNDPEGLHRWQRGQTGYPIVDAGMRQLWETGWMHNRVRMITASFLIKDLLIPWQLGQHWFWDCLVDADLANNSAGWQWVAGCGADAAPYFRIFNPTTQGQKFDPLGDYIRRWVPELAALSTAHIHNPSAAPSEVLERAGVVLGKDYPEPMVDHKMARTRALSALKELS